MLGQSHIVVCLNTKEVTGNTIHNDQVNQFAADENQPKGVLCLGEHIAR